MSFKERYGLIRSWMMYYGKPFNRSRLTAFYSSFVRSNDLVFDIGAHLGNRTQAFLDLGATVIAIEPQLNCTKFLHKKFGKNERFILINKLVGSHAGKQNFRINSTSPTISTARDKDWDHQINRYSRISSIWDQEVMTSVITLDLLITEYGLPAFCKIDTEGFEWEVIQGLSHPIQALSLEYLAFDKDRMIKCIEKLNSLMEYRCNFSPGESQKWQWPEWKDLADVVNILKSDQLESRFGDFYFQSISALNELK